MISFQATFDVLLSLYIVVAYNSISGPFDCGAFKNSRANAANEVDDVIIGLLRESGCHIFQCPDLLIVDIVDDLKSQV
jgi:hypothetical protein